MSYYAHEKRHIPKNGLLKREIKYPDGTVLYEYTKNQTGAWCLDTACIGRVQKVFDSEKEAIEAWNRRVDDGKEISSSSDHRDDL